MQLVLSKLSPDLRANWRSKLKKTGKKQELVDRLVMALERKKSHGEEDDVGKEKSGFGDEESGGTGVASGRGEEEESERIRRRRKRRRRRRYDYHDDGRYFASGGVQHAKVRRRVVRRGGGISDATASCRLLRKRSEKEEQRGEKDSTAVNGTPKMTVRR